MTSPTTRFVSPTSQKVSFLFLPRLEHLVGFLVVFQLTGCADLPGKAEEKNPRHHAAVPVVVASVAKKGVPLELRAIGNVQAYSTVSVKPQAGGELLQVHFREGQDVEKGDLLFSVDPRPFQAALQQAEGSLAKDSAQLKQAEANLARDLAQLENARVQERRYKELFRWEYVAHEQYDQVRTARAALEATVEADRATLDHVRAQIHGDQALVDHARLQLSYTFVVAPIAGRTGNLMVNAGNIVKANDETPLVIINQVQPIQVAFSLPEQHLSDIKRYRAVGTIRVSVAASDQNNSSARGDLTFLDNTVDRTTGTIQLKATFSNADRMLWPGQFVQVVVTLTTQPDAITIPSQAVQTGQQGPFVFVVKDDFTVESRPVVVERVVNGDAVIGKGLAPGESVVVDGQVRLRPGALVRVGTAPSTAALPGEPR